LGGTELPTNLFLAPIAGYTDLAFRLVARRQGSVGLACTDLLCPQGVLRQNFRTQILMATCPEDWPLSVQLFGGDDDPLTEAARWCADAGFKVIDINMGCPVEKITGRNGGSALLCDPERTVRLAERVIAAVPKVAVTAKLRLGWDDSRIVAPMLARRLEEAGVQLITIHGRTKEMGFSGNVRMNGIGEVVAAVQRIPVIGNGDIRRPEDAAEMMRRTGCRGVMIGRGALSSPWLFRHTWHYLNTGELLPEPSIEEKCGMMREHFRMHVELRGEWPAVCEFRQRVTWYGKQLNPCRPLRDGMRHIRNAADFERVVDDFVAWRRSGAGDA
jgi:nifR3 family TIM-barrel protein